MRMRYLRTCAWGAALVVLCTTGCPNHEQEMFEQLSTSDFGLGFHFEQSSSQVQRVLGTPAGNTVRQGGVNVEEFYLPPNKEPMTVIQVADYPHAATEEDQSSVEIETPRLALTYHRDRLVRVFNLYYPQYPGLDLPPFYLVALPEVKLGSRKSAFIDALGQTDIVEDQMSWRFVDKDGRSVVVEARFADEPGTEESLCYSLSVSLVPAVTVSPGEQAEKNVEWREMK